MIIKTYDSGLLDSRKYNDVCFLGKLLCILDKEITNEEKEQLKKRFEKVNIDE